MSHWIELQGLGLTEGDIRIVEDISLKVSHGSTAILGPNGAGKSTLLRLMHGLLRPSTGQVAWPQPLTQAMVFQRPVMLRSTALANIEYGLRLRAHSAVEQRKRALAALARVGLPELAQRQARRCSGGEQQRIALRAPGRWNRRCSSSTNQPPASTRPAAVRSSASSAKSPPPAPGLS